MQTIIELKDLSKTYEGGIKALKKVNLKIKKGEFLVLLGLSGSGKSTLLRCLNRLIEPTSGDILFHGKGICNLSGVKLRQLRQRFGMIYQHFNLVHNMSVLINVISGNLGNMNLWQTLYPYGNQEIIQRAFNNLKKVGLIEYKHSKVKNLSGGQLQRVAISRTLMQQPEIILADEPVASLDPATADSVMQYLGKLNKEDGITIICSLHFLSLARKYGSRVIALKDGELVFSGTPDEIDEKKFHDIYGEEAEEVEIK